MTSLEKALVAALTTGTLAAGAGGYTLSARPPEAPVADMGARLDRIEASHAHALAEVGQMRADVAELRATAADARVTLRRVDDTLGYLRAREESRRR